MSRSPGPDDTAEGVRGAPAGVRNEEATAEDAAERAADLEVERRSRITMGIWLLLAAGLRVSPPPELHFVERMNAAIAVMLFFIGLRIGATLLARGYPVASRARRLILGVPFLAHVAAWSCFMTVEVAASSGTWFPFMATMVQCLGAASAIISYSARAPLAAAIVGVLIVPPALMLLVGGSGPEHTLGGLSLVYAGLNWTVLPRLARERRSAMLSMELLAARARALEEARDATLKAAAGKDAFFANLSHEIRTPLHGLLGIVDRLRHSPLSGDQRVAVDQLHRSGQALLATLNDALDSARLESGQLRLRPEPFSLHELLGDVVQLFSEEARRKSVALELHTQHALPEHVVGDPQRLRQVLQNLIGNAVKFTVHGSVVVTATARPSETGSVELAVDVVDTGVGFDARESARLFQRFSQLGDGSRSGGTGLGLAISADLVHLMGGEIDGASPGPGRGATFTVHIPLLVADTAEDLHRRLSGKRVLVVDDNPVNLAVARGYLESMGLAVEEAGGGDDALERAARARFDVILMDCQMPGCDGLEATRKLRARGDVTPVVAVTAGDDDSALERCTAAGMDALVQKPVSVAALRAVLGRVLPGAQDSESTTAAKSAAPSSPLAPATLSRPAP